MTILSAHRSFLLSQYKTNLFTFTSEEKFVTIFLYPAFFSRKFIHLSKIFSGGRLINSSTSCFSKGVYVIQFKPIIDDNTISKNDYIPYCHQLIPATEVFSSSLGLPGVVSKKIATPLRRVKQCLRGVRPCITLYMIAELKLDTCITTCTYSSNCVHIVSSLVRKT